MCAAPNARPPPVTRWFGTRAFSVRSQPGFSAIAIFCFALLFDPWPMNSTYPGMRPPAWFSIVVKVARHVSDVSRPSIEQLSGVCDGWKFETNSGWPSRLRSR